MEPLSADDATSLFNTCLCHMRVDVLGRGSPSDMAMVYKVGGGERSELLDSLSSPDSSSAEKVALESVGPLGQEPIGFVSTGNISLTRGKGHGLATVSLSGYLDVLRAGASPQAQPGLPVVLLRNRNSLAFRVAALQPVRE